MQVITCMSRGIWRPCFTRRAPRRLGGWGRFRASAARLSSGALRAVTQEHGDEVVDPILRVAREAKAMRPRGQDHGIDRIVAGNDDDLGKEPRMSVGEGPKRV